MPFQLIGSIAGGQNRQCGRRSGKNEPDWAKRKEKTDDQR